MADNIVKTKQGAVRGINSEGVMAFKGIPYAAPPFGPNRFLPPQPASGWEGVREANAFGPTVPKPPYFPPFDKLLPEPVIEGEDCLNLNVWTPNLGASGLPVMVWIHGGAFANGTGAIDAYDGARFARDGVVCVTINYRLGADGFLFVGDGDSANRGILDQIAALEWVQANIEAFGGDPVSVTIFGESAGAMSVTTLLSMPRAEGLFRRAIAQSGAGHHAISAATAQKVARYLAEKLEVEPTSAAIIAVPLAKLLQAQVELSTDAFQNPDPQRWGEVAANLMPFEPVIDGDIIPAMPIVRIGGGAGANVDILVGSNADEERLFMVPNGVINYINQDILHGTLAAYGLPVEKTLEAYRANHPDASPGDLMEAIVTDWFFRIPAIRLAEAHSTGSGSTYMYEFAWKSPQYDGKLGACHALEIPFVFDTLDREGYEEMFGAAPPPQELADAMHAAWVAFAKHGDPGWPKYDQEQRTTMEFGPTSQLVNDPRAEQRKLWEGLR